MVSPGPPTNPIAEQSPLMLLHGSTMGFDCGLDIARDRRQTVHLDLRRRVLRPRARGSAGCPGNEFASAEFSGSAPAGCCSRTGVPVGGTATGVEWRRGQPAGSARFSEAGGATSDSGRSSAGAGKAGPPTNAGAGGFRWNFAASRGGSHGEHSNANKARPEHPSANARWLIAGQVLRNRAARRSLCSAVYRPTPMPKKTICRNKSGCSTITGSTRTRKMSASPIALARPSVAVRRSLRPDK